MLVYANTLQVVGNDAFEASTRAVHGWLAEQLGQKLPLADILRPGQWSSEEGKKSAWLRAYAATGENPEMYAWRLKHGDADVSGRQWLVEIGLRNDQGVIDFSCTVHTEELSVLITDPVSASRPRLIRYLLDNLNGEIDAKFAVGTPGIALKAVGSSSDSYRALLFDVQRTERDYPIVLVSPDRDGRYSINPDHLQGTLLGLAQVVRVEEGFSSWEMEEALGRQFSAWDGAINLIRIPNRYGVSHSNICLTKEVEGWGESQASRVSAMLARVTHNTNVPRQRKRIRADGVAKLEVVRRISKQRQALRDHGGHDKGMLEFLEQGLGELTEQNRKLQEDIDSKELEFMQLQDEMELVDQDLRAERFRSSQLLSQAQSGQSTSVDVSIFLDIASRADHPSPKDCLEAIELAYPNRIVVLDSAYDSARKHAAFESGRRLLGLFRRLATEFVDELLKGGDDRARKCFTSAEYAATESEGTQNNKEMRRKRTFFYDGRDVEMWRHLKIGVVDDSRRSIRVYFEWMPDEKKIVVGHCGAHLPIISY